MVPGNSFTAPAYTTGNGTLFHNQFAVGDFNGDGNVDLVLTVQSIPGAIVLFFGDGKGAFQPPVKLSVGSYIYSVAVSDFNGDGRTDLVLAAAGGVRILLGNGDGTFRPPINYSINRDAFSFAVGDFNGNGKADLVVVNSQSSSPGLSVFLGNGDGTLQGPVSYTAGTLPLAVAIGDFNGDGKADLAVANETNGNNVSVLLGNGDGTFQPAVTFDTGYSAVAIVAEDFNGDGNLDLAVMNYDSSGMLKESRKPYSRR